ARRVAAARAGEDTVLLRLDPLDPPGRREGLRIRHHCESHPVRVVGDRGPELPGTIPAIGALRRPVAIESGGIAGEYVGIVDDVTVAVFAQSYDQHSVTFGEAVVPALPTGVLRPGHHVVAGRRKIAHPGRNHDRVTLAQRAGHLLLRPGRVPGHAVDVEQPRPLV